MIRHPDIFLHRKDNGWVYVLKQSASAESEGVHVDGTPLVLTFWATDSGEGKDFKLTLEEVTGGGQEVTAPTQATKLAEEGPCGQ